MKYLFLFLFYSLNLFAYEYEVSIAAMFRDEARFLKEWIEYHRLIGVEHFYLYNDNSRDNFKEVLNPYIKAGVVELFDNPKTILSRGDFRKILFQTLMEAAGKAKGISKWIAFIDIDEFIFPVADKSLPHFLSRYEKYGAVTINWQVFGTSNLKRLKDDQLMIEQLVFRAEKNYFMNHYFKSIVQVQYLDLTAQDSYNHIFPLLEGRITVNVNEVPMTGFQIDETIPIDKIRIHHYFSRDEQFLEEVKLKRPNANPTKIQNILYDVSNSNKVEDRSILIYADDLRNRLK